MKKLGNPYYKDITLNFDDYLKNCKESNNENFTFSSDNQTEFEHEVSSNVEMDSSTNSFIADVLENPEKDEENDEEKEFIKNDTIRKFQFN